MEYRILGPLEVWDAGRRLDIDAPKQRAILAVLILHANEVVSTDRLLDLVWGDEPPSGGVRTLRFHISRLRDALQPGRAQGVEGVVATRAPGYVLLVDPDQLDASRFERMADEARMLLVKDPSRALDVIDDALELWRGSPLSDLTYEEFARPEIVRLEELRLRVIEDRVDAALALGRHEELIGELRTAIEEQPLRERRWGQLMTALYRAGRQAEALDAYRAVRAQLGEELGIEPSSDLAALEERILLQDTTLLEPGPVPSVERLRGYVLHEKLGEGAFGVVWRATQPGVGREVAIKAIRPELANRAEFVRRFETEAKLVAGLEHPHVVSLFDFWRDPDGAYLVMPYLQGGSLGRALRQGRIDAKAGLQMIEAVGSALAYAHRRGVIHRDVSPENVLLDAEGNPYLGDLGVAVLIGEQGMPPTPSPAYASPEQLEGEAAVPASDVYSLAMLTFTVLTGTDPPAGKPLPAIAEFDGEVSPAVDEILTQATAPRPEDRFPDVESFLAALAAAVGPDGAVAPPPVEVRNPYKGLRAFEETDALDFFGRDLLVSELVDAVARHRLVGVVGPSGCGKSSLVRAGLIPSLRRGAMSGSDRWLITDMYPGARPFDELEAALMGVAVYRPAGLADHLHSDEESPIALFEALLPDRADLLLVVDQFEELFTLTTDDAARRRFMELLTALAENPASRVRVVVTLRADFFDRPLQHAGFGELLRRGLVPVTMPSEESLVQAVTGPAGVVGLDVEPGLASESVRDVSDQPGGLPLLEYALTELFHRRADGRLTLDAYHASGGVLGALGRRAEELLAVYDEAGRAAVRQVFLRLVAVEEGTTDTRRRIPRTELHGLGLDAAALEQVLNDYGSHRLLTFDRDPVTRAPTVEVAHEALLTRWDRLRGWIDDRRDDLVLHRHLATAVAEWMANERQSEYLLTGGRLEHYEAFAADTDLALTDDEREFLAASRRHDDEIAAARRRRRRTVLAGFAAAAVVALVLAVVAFASQQRADDSADEAEAQRVEAQRQAGIARNQQAIAEENARIANEKTQLADEEAAEAVRQARLVRSRELAASAIGVLDDDPELSLMLALEATTGNEPIFESITAVHEALLAHRILLRVEADWGALAPSGEAFIATSANRIISYDTSTGRERWSEALPSPWLPAYGGAFFTPDGDRFIVTLEPVPEGWAEEAEAEPTIEIPEEAFDAENGAWGVVLIFDAETGEWSAPTFGVECDYVELIPDGHGRIHLDRPLLAETVPVVNGECDGNAVSVVEIALDSGAVRELERFVRAAVKVGRSSTDAARSHLVLSIENETTVIDLLTGERTVYGAPTSYGYNQALSTDGSLLLTMLGPSTVWDTTTDTVVATFPQEIGRGLAWFSRDDTQIVTENGIWDIATSDPVVSFGGGEGPASMSDDGRLAITNHDETLLLWELGTHGEIGAVHLPGFGYQPRNLNVAAGRGAVMESGSTGFGPVLVFDLESGDITHQLPGATGYGVAISPDGHLVAFQEEPEPDWIGTVRVHDLEKGDVIRMKGFCAWDNDAGVPETCAALPRQPFAAIVYSLQFNPDGSRLVAFITAVGPSVVDQRSAVVIWDTATGEILRTEEGYWWVSLMPDSEAMVLAEEDRIDVGDLAGGPMEQYAVMSGIPRFSADGSRFATGYGFIAVYDTATWTELQVIGVPEAPFHDLAISPDGSKVATAGTDGFVRVYDGLSLELLQAIPIGREITNVEFVNDDHVLAVPRSGPGYIVTTDVDELLALAESRVTRDFTAEECATYRIDSCPHTEELDGDEGNE